MEIVTARLVRITVAVLLTAAIKSIALAVDTQVCARMIVANGLHVAWKDNDYTQIMLLT